MRAYIATILISLFAVGLSLLTIDYVLIRIFGGGFFLLVTCFLAVGILAILRRVRKVKRYAISISLIPALLMATFILLFLSSWAHKRDVFVVALGQGMPRSVENFVFEEDAWTDYTLRFHCEIAPPDLRRILTSGGFEVSEGEQYREYEIGILDGKEIPAIHSPIVYHRVGGGGGMVVVNPEYSRLFVIYMAD